VIDSADDVCPVCMHALHGGGGWAIRRSGRWIRFRTRHCLDEYERRTETNAAADRDEPPGADTSPCSEWALY
jgi:hypothetical protein